MFRFSIHIIFGLMLGLTFSCTEPNRQRGHTSSPIAPVSNNDARPDDQFADYWFQGKAEISTYRLEQARYGQIHDGHAVLIFVTEDFSREKQVKLDNPQEAGDDRVPILKLNFVKKFNTGIYPYSMMQSVFSPIDLKADPHPLKTTMSAQEWCGHTFTQLNLDGNQYAVKGFSYFESEGDVEVKLPAVWLEDELWNRIRLNPESLPVGEFRMVPGSFFLRLKHRPLEAVSANAIVKNADQHQDALIYELVYPKYDRTLRITYERAFPHKILEWEETYRDGWSAEAPMLTTKASLMKQIKSAYWKQHNTEHERLRRELNLED